jgi:acyl carrier protein
MTREQVAKEVLSILAEVRGLDPRLINEASDLSELGVTSLDALSIAFEIENRFQISVPDEQIPTFKTVGSVVDAVLGHFTQARP